MKTKENMLQKINEFCAKGYRALEDVSEKKEMLAVLGAIDDLFVEADFFYQEKDLEDVMYEYEVIQLKTKDGKELSIILQSNIVAKYDKSKYIGAAYGERDYDFYVFETDADGNDGIFIEVNSENTNWMNALSKVGLLDDERRIEEGLLQFVYNYAETQNRLLSDRYTLTFEVEGKGLIVENRHKTISRLTSKGTGTKLHIGKATKHQEISKEYVKMTVEELKDKRKELDVQIAAIIEAAFEKISKEENISYKLDRGLTCAYYVGYENDGENAYFTDWGVAFEAKRKNGPKEHFEIYVERESNNVRPKRYETVYCSSAFNGEDKVYRTLCGAFEKTPGINQLLTDLYQVNTVIDDKKYFDKLVKENPEFANVFERVIGSSNAVGYLVLKDGKLLPLVNEIVVDEYIG